MINRIEDLASKAYEELTGSTWRSATGTERSKWLDVIGRVAVLQYSNVSQSKPRIRSFETSRSKDPLDTEFF